MNVVVGLAAVILRLGTARKRCEPAAEPPHDRFEPRITDAATSTNVRSEKENCQ